MPAGGEVMHLQIETSTSLLDRCAAGLKVQMGRLARSADNIAHMSLPVDAASPELSPMQHGVRDIDLPAEVVNVVDAGNAYMATLLMMRRCVEMEDDLLEILA